MEMVGVDLCHKCNFPFFFFFFWNFNFVEMVTLHISFLDIGVGGVYLGLCIG
jgi:hypothetical protein